MTNPTVAFDLDARIATLRLGIEQMRQAAEHAKQAGQMSDYEGWRRAMLQDEAELWHLLHHDGCGDAR